MRPAQKSLRLRTCRDVSRLFEKLVVHCFHIKAVCTIMLMPGEVGTDTAQTIELADETRERPLKFWVEDRRFPS